MSNRPEFINNNDITRWDEDMKNDEELPVVLFNDPTVREVCYAGLWLCEQLRALQCPEEYVMRIQYTAGTCSFGREPWGVHQEFLELYKLNGLEFEPDPENIN